jgi:hypothetical protein
LGNIEAGYYAFQHRHQCNDFCTFFELKNPSEINFEPDSSQSDASQKEASDTSDAEGDEDEKEPEPTINPSEDEI